MPGSDHGGRRRVTLRTIADEVGVNVSTVSRALSGRRDGGENPSETARRIVEAADRLGYVRDATAASLRTQRIGAFGVLVPRLTDIVLATVYEAVEETAAGLGYETVVSSTRDDPELQRRRVELLLGRRIDGLILGDARLDNGFVDELAERNVPFVLVSRRAGEHVAVTIDDKAGGRLAATHLADLGHRRIGILAGVPYASTGCDRRDGALTALAERGIDIPSRYVVDSGYDTAGGHEAAVRLLSQEPRVTAIFAVNDFTAVGAMGAIRDLGLAVGDDIAVVGYNDTAVARELPVPLTSVRSPHAEMGRMATHMLLERIAGKEMSSVRLPPRLVVRQSSDTSAAPQWHGRVSGA
ncbi:MAG: LacI family transcriptional regulator [Actinomycetota bacterium]|nr:LacI family transcriptional regulator [Actinomycetota bacterium]